MNNKGQALMEFIIVIPIIIMVLFALIDFGFIFYNKNKLESKLNDVTLMIKNDDDSKINKYLNDVSNINKIKYKVINESDYKTIELYTYQNIITPGLNIVLKSPYKISVTRVIYE